MSPGRAGGTGVPWGVPIYPPCGHLLPTIQFCRVFPCECGEKDRDSSFPVGERVLEGAHS